MTLNLEKWPFGKLVASSVALSALHAIVQLKWPVIRFHQLGPRPIATQALIALEVLLLMVVFTAGMTRVSNDESDEPKGRYYLGMAAAVSAWIGVLYIS